MLSIFLENKSGKTLGPSKSWVSKKQLEILG
jgi:hypothetical protein